MVKGANDIQINKGIHGGGVVGGEETHGFIGLLDYSVDIVDVGDGFKNLLVLFVINLTLFLGFLDHMVVMLD